MTMTETLPNLSLLAPPQPPEQAASRARAVTQVAAVLLVALGLATMVGWLLRAPGLLQILPGQVAMAFGTALCFALAGAALLIPTRWPVLRRRVLPAVGGLIVLAAAAMLVQQFLHVDLGIDLRWLHAWLGDPNPTPGRMAPNTALAFLLAGLALMLMPHARTRAALRTIETLAFGVVFIGLVSGAGYTLHLEFLYGWYQYTRMALPTAVGMVVLGVGLLGAWRQLAAAGPLLQLQAQNRIVWIGGSIFFTIALVAGLGGFAMMQQRTEATLQDGLLRSVQSRSDFFATAIDDASRTARLIATRPAIYRFLRKLNAEPGDANVSPCWRSRRKAFCRWVCRRSRFTTCSAASWCAPAPSHSSQSWRCRSPCRTRRGWSGATASWSRRACQCARLGKTWARWCCNGRWTP